MGWVGKGTPVLGQKMTTVKSFTSGTFGGSLISEGHRNVSSLKVTGFGTLGRPSTSGETGRSKRDSKVPLGDRPDSPESSLCMGAALAGLRVSQLKMDMPPVFIASRQQNMRSWLTKMERYLRLMRYPADT